MSKNSQKLNCDTLRTWLVDVNPTSESLHQPKVVVTTERKPFKSFKK